MRIVGYYLSADYIAGWIIWIMKCWGDERGGYSAKTSTLDDENMYTASTSIDHVELNYHQTPMSEFPAFLVGRQKNRLKGQYF